MQRLDIEVAENLHRSGQRWHGGVVACRLHKLKQSVERTLVESGNHRLGDIAEEVIQSEARAGQRIDPVIDKQAADDQPQQKVRQIACANRMRMEAPYRHPGGVPIDDHVDQREEGDATQLGQSKLRQYATVLRGQIRQIVGELVEPVHAGTRAR